MPRLTLLRAKEALQHKAPADRLEFRINRVVERYLDDGEFSGADDLAIVAPYGQLTLPRYYRSIDGLKVGTIVYDVANQWYEMLPSRSGLPLGIAHVARDLGDGRPTIYNCPADGSLQLSYAGLVDWPVTIYGTDANALPVSLTIPDQAPLPNPFTVIDRVHKEFSDVSVRLYHFDADFLETNLALMAPKEEETYYRRYMLDDLSTTATTTVAVLAKLRHIEFSDDQDVLPISHIGALELGMDALQYEAENDVTLAEQYWRDGVSVLNKELFSIDGETAYPVIKMVYPGKTAPRFQSHY